MEELVRARIFLLYWPVVQTIILGQSVHWLFFYSDKIGVFFILIEQYPLDKDLSAG